MPSRRTVGGLNGRSVHELRAGTGLALGQVGIHLGLVSPPY